MAVYDVQSPARTFPLPGAWSGGVDLEMTQQPPDSVIDSSDTLNPLRRTRQAYLATIHDGLSNTAMVVEQSGKPAVYGIVYDSAPTEPGEGPWASAEYSSFHGEGVNLDNRSDPFGFHGSANVVMCDGSTHTWSADMDARRHARPHVEGWRGDHP